MPFRIPQSTDECLYFTNRGYISGWVYRKLCPKCKKATMGKPVEKGKVKTRAKEFVCPNCHYTEDQATHENSVRVEAVYTCPKCGKKGESTAPYTRVKYHRVPSYVVSCQHCGEKMPLTKKLKEVD